MDRNHWYSAGIGNAWLPYAQMKTMRPPLPVVRTHGCRIVLADGVDYLCLEALAELTLAILQKDRQRDEDRGYTRDLPAYLERALPAVVAGTLPILEGASVRIRIALAVAASG